MSKSNSQIVDFISIFISLGILSQVLHLFSQVKNKISKCAKNIPQRCLILESISAAYLIDDKEAPNK
jgi:hypothetical protein